MTKLDFLRIAQDYARSEGQEYMLPVIEKEILHYEVLNSLDRQGLFDVVVFQGGTCLRLCYGGVRYSEDLDFAAGAAFDDIVPEELARELEKDVGQRFDVGIRVKAPVSKASSGSVDVRKWWLVVDTAPERPDLPSQKIKIEISSVPSYARQIQRVELHYENLPAAYDTLIIPCESREEIFADKIIAFANSPYVRYRDIWDMSWLLHRPAFDINQVSPMVLQKHKDYACDLSIEQLLDYGAQRAGEESFNTVFVSEMRRFIPVRLLERTVGRKEYLSVIGGDVVCAYQEIKSLLRL